MRVAVIWTAFALAVGAPVWIAATSPLLQWRDPVYIAAGLAGVGAMALLLAQPLLARGLLPGLSIPQSRRLHARTGAALVALIVAHVAGLWLTSPPDVIDALTFTSPTPFSAWGVIAMWAVFATALLATLKRRLRLSPASWRRGHSALAVVIVAGSTIHALLIEGTMGTLSKTALCALAIAATAKALHDLRIRGLLKRR